MYSYNNFKFIISVGFNSLFNRGLLNFCFNYKRNNN